MVDAAPLLLLLLRPITLCIVFVTAKNNDWSKHNAERACLDQSGSMFKNAKFQCVKALSPAIHSSDDVEVGFSYRSSNQLPQVYNLLRVDRVRGNSV